MKRRTIKRLYLEITNQCNLNCSFCQKSKRPISFLSLPLIEKAMKESLELTDYLYLHVQGEPLLYPDFPAVLKLAEKYQRKIQLVSNGTHLADFEEELLTSKSLRKISISLQSLFCSENLEEKLLALESFIQKAGKTDIIVELRIWADQQEVIRDYLCETFGKEHTYNQDTRLGESLYLSVAKEFKWPNLQAIVNTTAKSCIAPRLMLCVLSDGTITPCCLDIDGLINLGNIRNNSLMAALNSESYQQMLLAFQDNKVLELLCKHCEYKELK